MIYEEERTALADAAMECSVYLCDIWCMLLIDMLYVLCKRTKLIETTESMETEEIKQDGASYKMCKKKNMKGCVSSPAKGERG